MAGGGGRETCVWCLFAQGRVARALGDGRGWKALVARRCRAQKRVLPGDLPILASSCRLDPGCAHCPISASPANLISARNLEAAADRSGLLGGTAAGRGGEIAENPTSKGHGEHNTHRSRSWAILQRCQKWELAKALQEKERRRRAFPC